MPVTQPTGAITTIAAGTYADAIFSPDGSQLYATSGNTVIVIDVGTGSTLAEYTVGTELGAIDVSVDGRYLAVVEAQGGSGTGTIYRINLATGAVATYSTAITSESFFDVSFLANGTVLISQDVNSSTAAPLMVLRFSTGTFTTVSSSHSFPDATLTASADRVEVFVEPRAGTRPMFVYTSGVGITAQNVEEIDDPYGGASFPPAGSGVHAISPTGDVLVQGISLGVYDGSLTFQLSLATKHPYLGAAQGMAFSPDGTRLYVLLTGDGEGQVVVLNTSNWNVIGAYGVDTNVPVARDSIAGTVRGYGDMIQASADGNYLSVIGTDGIQVIDLSVVKFESTQGADDLSGDGTLLGFGGDDVLTGTGYGGWLYGGAGDDTYYVSTYGHILFEYAYQGHDTVHSTVDHGLGAAFEDLVLRGTDNIFGHGNDRANVIVGNAGANELDGYEGDDTIRGGGGDDILIGNVGVDRLNGGAGSDLYMVERADDHSIAEIDDTGASGTDELRLAAYSWYGAQTLTLFAGDSGIERIVIGFGQEPDAYTEDVTPHNVVASALGNAVEIVGNDGANRLWATRFSDQVHGGDGADVINGGGSVDSLDGGDGGDVYYVGAASHHSASEFADTGTYGKDEVRFAAGGSAQTLVVYRNDVGIERIVIGTGYEAAAVTTGTLAHNVDARTLLRAVEIIGNDGANRLDATAYNDKLYGRLGDDQLYGRGGNDILDGGLGADKMVGGTGDDRFVVDNAGDIASELNGQGHDHVAASVSFTIRGHVEDLTLTGSADINGGGNALANVITGNKGANVLFGRDGDDILHGGSGDDQIDGGAGDDLIAGGTGVDTLLGGAGADEFRFDSPLNATTNVDIIVDFSVADDRIALDADIFTEAGAPGTLSTAAFRRGTAAQDADDRIIYDSATGNIYYDADGNGVGSAVLFAQVDAGTLLTRLDFDIFGAATHVRYLEDAELPLGVGVANGALFGLTPHLAAQEHWSQAHNMRPSGSEWESSDYFTI